MPVPGDRRDALSPPLAILCAALLFNLGQGVLRPSLPLYLERSFAANYRMVTLIPVVFGAGKWMASLPTGYLLGRIGRRLMVCGLLLIAVVDAGSIAVSRYDLFLGLRGLGGVGWAMFTTVATTAVVTRPAGRRRGRALGVLLTAETAGLLLGSAGGGWLYQGAGATSPFLFEALCMIVAAAAVAGWARLPMPPAPPPRGADERGLLRSVLRVPAVRRMGAVSALLVAVQTGVLVFLLPLHLLQRGGLSPGAVGVVVSLGVLGRLAALWLGGGVSDRWGRMKALVPGLLVYAALLGSLPWVAHPVSLGVWSFAIGAAAGFVATIPTALVGDEVPPASHGVAIGWLRTVTDAGQIVGPLVMGVLADGVDLSAPFVLGALLLAAAAWRCRRRARAADAGLGMMP